MSTDYRPTKITLVLYALLILFYSYYQFLSLNLKNINDREFFLISGSFFMILFLSFKITRPEPVTDYLESHANYVIMTFIVAILGLLFFYFTSYILELLIPSSKISQTLNLILFNNLDLLASIWVFYRFIKGLICLFKGRCIPSNSIY